MYRLANELLRPYTLLWIIAAASSVWGWRRRESRWPRRTLVVALGALWLISTPALRDLGFATLEAQTAPLAGLPTGSEAIVVLSGGVLPITSKQLRALPDEDTLYRCLAAAELYRERPCPVVVTGGIVDLADETPPLAELMYDLLVQIGVDPQDLSMENRSRSTYENAVETQRLLKQQGRRRIVLVTEGWHMPRAAACFRRQGLQVTEAPCHFITGKCDWKLAEFLPSAAAARGSERVVHEWLGMIWYWLKGRI